jgi:predicted RNase H-like HicB family nuclease
VVRNFTVILEKQPAGGYHVYCPALKGCHSEGETEQEAMENIHEALEVYLENLLAHNEPIPCEELRVRSVPVGV